MTTPCNYNRVGEINGDLRRMVCTQFGDTTLFSVHSDDAPNVYVNGTSQPSRPDRSRRPQPRAGDGQLSWLNPYTERGREQHHGRARGPDRDEDAAHGHGGSVPDADIHAVRRSRLVLLRDRRRANCATPAACAFIPARTRQSFAWNHGDIQDEIASTWVGMVGPGVKTEPDYTGSGPTTPTFGRRCSTLLGLKDDYQTDGRAVVEPLFDWAVPQTLRAHRETLLRLGEVYKQLTASFGSFAMYTLVASTKALASGSSTDDSTYTTHRRADQRI